MDPIIYKLKDRRRRTLSSNENDIEPIFQEEIFDHLRDIKDPEVPKSLEELCVVTKEGIEVDDQKSYVRVTFKPTNKHCSMTTLIGLCILVKLMRSLPKRYKVDIRLLLGSHATEAAVNKQLNGKERVAGALENQAIVDMIEECLAPSYE